MFDWIPLTESTVQFLPMKSACGVSFVVVFTPHFLDRMRERVHIFSTSDAAKMRSDLPRLFDEARRGSTRGSEDTFYDEYGRSYVYFKRKFNESRDRWEMEMISVTPNDRAHTRELTFAKHI